MALYKFRIIIIIIIIIWQQHKVEGKQAHHAMHWPPILQLLLVSG